MKTYLEEHFRGEGVGKRDERLVRVGFLPKRQGRRICILVTLQCRNLEKNIPLFTGQTSRIAYPHEPFAIKSISIPGHQTDNGRTVRWCPLDKGRISLRSRALCVRLQVSLHWKGIPR